MKSGGKSTLCVSTQAGCRMGCVFCASTVGGLSRNLSAGEICAQVYASSREANVRIDRIVMMGCGEPLDNYEASIKFISLITHPDGAAIGQRHVTLSTCGLVSRIRRLADENLQITLAVSLHAPDDQTRRTIMPSAKANGVRELIGACGYYIKATRRRVTFEYTLIGGINDTHVHAVKLAELLRGMLCHVNLIPVNETDSVYKKSMRTAAFAKELERLGVNVTVRRSLGEDVEGACGQLRKRYLSNQN